VNIGQTFLTKIYSDLFNKTKKLWQIFEESLRFKLSYRGYLKLEIQKLRENMTFDRGNTQIRQVIRS